MATFISPKRFIEHVTNNAPFGGPIHFTIDVTFQTVILYGAPPTDELVNVGLLARWENGFAIFAQPDELSRKNKRLALDEVTRFLMTCPDHEISFGVVSSFYLDDLDILKNLPAEDAA